MSQILLILFISINLQFLKCDLDALQDVACWKRSYGRGIGSFKCGIDEEKNGLLCYPKCEENYVGVGPVCWESVCPKDRPINCGLSCTKTSEACGRIISLHLLTPVLSLTVPIKQCNITSIKKQMSPPL